MQTVWTAAFCAAWLATATGAAAGENKLLPPEPLLVDDLHSALEIEPAAGFREDGESLLHYNWRRIETPDLGPYNAGIFMDQAGSIPWSIAAVVAGTTAQGIIAWNWGNDDFRFNSEGWFGKDTGSLGMDKLGHAYTTYVYSEFFTQRIAHRSDDLTGAAITGALLAMGIQTYVEVFDGFSDDHGFSREDMVMNGLGAGFSVLRSTVPGLAEKLDFRMEYIPSGNNGDFRPASDYSGQKFILALKLSGFEAFEDTPLRFVELHAGYFARGFTDEEEARGEELRREPYIGIGLNLQELLDAGIRKDTTAGLIAKRTLEYVQVPYTYAATSQY